MDERVYEQTRRIEEAHWWFRGMRRIYRKQIARAVSSHTTAGSSSVVAPPGTSRRRILDVGCGTGGNRSVLEEFGEVWGVDSAVSAVSFARDRGWPRVLLGSATDLPIPDATFDLVTALGVIEHVPDDERMLSELLRVVRPGGHMLLMTSAHPWLWSVHDDAVHHQRRYRKFEFGDRIRGAGWVIEQLSFINAFLFPPIAVIRLLQRLVPGGPAEEDREMSGFFIPPLGANRLLEELLAFEGTLMSLGNLPAGVGLLCRARRAELP
jgi:SAM-dependent methyltransferase